MSEKLSLECFLSLNSSPAECSFSVYMHRVEITNGFSENCSSLISSSFYFIKKGLFSFLFNQLTADFSLFL